MNAWLDGCHRYLFGHELFPLTDRNIDRAMLRRGEIAALVDCSTNKDNQIDSMVYQKLIVCFPAITLIDISDKEWMNLYTAHDWTTVLCSYMAIDHFFFPEFHSGIDVGINSTADQPINESQELDDFLSSFRPKGGDAR